MKIIFLGLLIAVLVVFGLGDNSNEFGFEVAICEFPNPTEKRLNAALVENAEEIEENRKKDEESAKEISFFRAEISNPNTPHRDSLQGYLDILIERYQKTKEIHERRAAVLKQIDEDIKQGLETHKDMDKLWQRVLTARESINSATL